MALLILGVALLAGYLPARRATRVVGPDDLGLRAPAGGSTKLERMTLEEVEAHLIRKALQRTGGNVSAAAEKLGLSRSALYRRLKAHGIEP